MFFRKEKVEWNVLNDIDNDIVNLYICVLDKFDELTERIYWYPRSRTLFDQFKETVKDSNIDIPDAKRASEYFFVLRNSFNNMMGSSFSKDTKWDTGIAQELKVSRKRLDGATI